MAVAIDALPSAQSGATIQFNGVQTINSSTNGLTLTPTASATAVLGCVVFSGPAVTSPTATWNGVAMTLLADTGNKTNGGNNDRAILFGLGSPATGSGHAFVVSWTTATAGYINIISLKGTDTTTPFKNATTNTGTGTSATVPVTSPSGDMALGACLFANGAATVGQTTWWNDDTGANDNGLGNYTAGAGSTSLTATIALSSTWAYAAVDAQVPLATGGPFVSKVTDLPPRGFVYSKWADWIDGNNNLPPLRDLTKPFKQTDYPNPIDFQRSSSYAWTEPGNNLPPLRDLTKPSTEPDFPVPYPITWYRSFESSGNSLTA